MQLNYKARPSLNHTASGMQHGWGGTFEQLAAYLAQPEARNKT
jgi:hypothetical protein